MEHFDYDDMALFYALLNDYDEYSFQLIENEKQNVNQMQSLADEYQGIIVYGAGKMYEYFINTYPNIPIKYVVDSAIPENKVEKRGLYEVHPKEKLKQEKKEAPIIITPVRPSVEIYEQLKREGFKNIYVLAILEYRKKDVKEGVIYFSKHPELQEKYLRISRRESMKMHSVKRRIAELESRSAKLESRVAFLEGSLKAGRTYYYKYILHCNRMINVLIDNLPDLELRRELIKDQISFRFCHEFANNFIPNLENPRSFNEKNLAMQINETDNPLFIKVTDKYEMKKYVADIIGEEYVVPALGVWEKPEDIEWDNLPDNILLKATNGGDSDSIFIVKENDEETRQKAIEVTRKWVMKSNNVYYSGFNGIFKNVSQRILAEPNIEENEGELLNYKIDMFHGEPILYYVTKVDLINENKKPELAYYRMDGTPIDVRSKSFPLLQDYRKTTRMGEMIEIARTLAKPFEFVRVDFMETPNCLKVGELTLTPSGGIKPFDSREIDNEFGMYW